MRILQVSNYIYPNIGGIEQVARSIIHAIAEIPGAEQKVICFNENAADGDYVCRRGETVHDQVDGVEVIRCGCFAKVASQSLALGYGAELKKLFRSFRPELVIFHYPNPFAASFLLPLLPKTCKLLMVWHLDIIKQKLLRQLFVGQNRRLLKRADVIAATTPNYIDGSPWLSSCREKCISLPICIKEADLVPTEAIRRRAEQIRQEEQGKVLCFAVGRHVPYKGLGYLIGASRYLDDSISIRIAGKGPLTEELKKQAEGDSKIRFMGRISQEELIAHYLACDIITFPSITKNEAFGISLAEGMYFGKPAVTFLIPGSGVNYVNLKEQTGLECPNGDTKAFAEAIMCLADDPALREKLGQAARKRVEENFTEKVYLEKFRDLVIQIMEK